MNPGARLADYLAAVHGRPFDWAAFNCCHFAAGWVKHATGRDPMEGLPATASAREALHLVRQLGGSVRAAWTQRLGVPELPAAQARVGDVVLLPVPEDLRGAGPGEVVGICAGLSAVACTDEGHHVFLPMQHAAAAWRVEVAA